MGSDGNNERGLSPLIQNVGNRASFGRSTRGGVTTTNVSVAMSTVVS
jgi:hypothetical protein